jgi:aryl-alcohol dehydrogenase-like predicted oxidoreductase
MFTEQVCMTGINAPLAAIGVTCAILATTNVAHVRENMNAGYGRLPDASMRQRIVGALERV